MIKPVKYSKELKEFETVGFVKSQSDLLRQLRMHYGRYLKIFCPGNKLSIGRSDAKYGTYEIFGDRLIEIVRRGFREFLIEKMILGYSEKCLDIKEWLMNIIIRK